MADGVAGSVGSRRYSTTYGYFHTRKKNKDKKMATETSSTNVKQLLDLSGKVAVITGGSIGLGRQMAEGLAEMGADVILCARKKNAVKRPPTSW